MKRWLFLLAVVSMLALLGCGKEKSSNVLENKDQQWCHLNLTSYNYVKIHLDYQVAYESDGDQYTILAKPFWINVENTPSDGSKNAQAVLVEWSYNVRGGGAYAWQGPVTKVDLKQENGRFAGEKKDGMKINSSTRGSDNPTGYSFELAVVVDDAWYKDTLTNQNYSFDLNRIPLYCAH